jgi:nucleotide-binding universal stress UspA family protein
VFDSIIVPLDGGPYAERALEPASRLARTTGAAIVTMSVVDEAGQDERHVYIEAITERLDVPTRSPYVLVSHDPEACIANAGEAEGSLIVMTSHARSRPSHALLGSVADSVVRALERPVLVIGRNWKESESWPRGSVTVPLDGSENAERILITTSEWCRATGADAWPITVVNPSREAGAGTDTGYVRQIAESLERDGVRCGWEVLHESDTADAIVTFTQLQDADLITMTTHGRTGLARLTLGSVAARVLHDAPCPVLLLRPSHLEA